MTVPHWIDGKPVDSTPGPSSPATGHATRTVGLADQTEVDRAQAITGHVSR